MDSCIYKYAIYCWLTIPTKMQKAQLPYCNTLVVFFFIRHSSPSTKPTCNVVSREGQSRTQLTKQQQSVAIVCAVSFMVSHHRLLLKANRPYLNPAQVISIYSKELRLPKWSHQPSDRAFRLPGVDPVFPKNDLTVTTAP